jgi:ABC-2 type transport system permease protein
MSFLTMLRFEWRVLRRERLLWVAVIFLGTLGLYAAFSGARFTAQQQQTIAELEAEHSQRRDSLGQLLGRLHAGDASVRVSAFADPRSPAVVGRGLGAPYTILPPATLAPLAIGQRDVQPFWAQVSTRTKQTFFVNDEIENPAVMVSGRLDLAFVILVVYPLIILALTFDAVAGERERGTLAIVLAQPVDPRRVLSAKLAARALLALALTLGLTFAAVLATGVSLGSADAWLRLALWCAVIVVYGAFWFGVSMAVNAARMSAAASAVSLLAVWLGVVVVLPAVAAAIVTVTHPSPSRLALTTRLREATDAAASNREDAMASFLIDHPAYIADASSGAPDPNVVSMALQDAAERLMAPEYAAFDSALDAQREAAAAFRFLSPALVTQSALLDLAGAGEARFRSYERQFDVYHASWRDFFFSRTLNRRPLTPADWDAIPMFRFAEESVGSLWRRLAPGLGLMLLLAMALGGLGRRGLTAAAQAR